MLIISLTSGKHTSRCKLRFNVNCKMVLADKKTFKDRSEIVYTGSKIAHLKSKIVRVLEIFFGLMPAI
jgi:hypothetical protein